MFSHNVVKAGRHDHGGMHTLRRFPGAHQFLDVGVAPVSDSGLFVLRDVRGRYLERRLVPGPATGERLLHDVTVRALRGVAIATG